jgi:methanesulfonate monooxygenase subunit alpha
MPAKNHKRWLANPPLQLGEWVDSRVCSDPRIFEDQLTIRRCPSQF